MASSRFQVDGTGGTIGPPPHFLVRTRSLQSWLRLPSRVSETKKRSVSLSHSQVSVLETLLSSVCEVTSWLDWWLSTCGGFCEHLSGEVRANFKRLMLSGSRALEFLGGQGVAALGNLVLSRRDSLLLDVRSMVPVEEVALLRHAFCRPLLRSSLHPYSRPL